MELNSDNQVRSERGPIPEEDAREADLFLFDFADSLGDGQPNIALLPAFGRQGSYRHARLSLLLVPIMASRVLDKKLKKVLDMRTDTPALLESLEAISTLFSDHGSSGAAAATTADGEKAGGAGHEYSTLDARRSLREDLERQVRLSNPTLNNDRQRS